MINFLNQYDWLLSTQVLLIICLVIYIIFYKRLKNYEETIVSIPFALCLSISMFTSSTLISLLFFSEITFNLSNILYRNKYRLYDNKFFENVRYLFWTILIFCYYFSFNTFKFQEVPKSTGVELTFVVVLLLSIVFVKLLSLFLKSEENVSSINESIGYEILTISVFSLKVIFTISSLMDNIIPKHHLVIDILVLSFLTLGCLLSLRLYKTKKIRSMKSIVRGVVLLSLFPLLTIGDNSFWENYTSFTILLIVTFLCLELVLRFVKNGRFKMTLVFILLCLLSGVTPFGHIFTLLQSLPDSSGQELLLIGVGVCTLTLVLLSRSLFGLCLYPGNVKQLK